MNLLFLIISKYYYQFIEGWIKYYIQVDFYDKNILVTVIATLAPTTMKIYTLTFTMWL